MEWLQELLKSDRKGYANCIARISQLAESGHELRRPSCDYLRDGIYELRAKHRTIQYRILYFFSGQNVVILANALIKKGAAVPRTDIERAIKHRALFEQDPAQYTYIEEDDDG